MFHRKPGLLHVLAGVRRDRLELLVKSLVEIWFLLESRQPLAERHGHRVGQCLAGEFCEAFRERMGFGIFDVEGHFYPIRSLLLPYAPLPPIARKKPLAGTGGEWSARNPPAQQLRRAERVIMHAIPAGRTAARLPLSQIRCAHTG